MSLEDFSRQVIETKNEEHFENRTEEIKEYQEMTDNPRYELKEDRE